jgi:hypothetical protein
MGVNDDWGYAWIARDLANTGHIHYNGWASSMLGWQLYWGALFIRLFGFSFTALRFSILIVATVSVFVLHRLFSRCGMTLRNATLATLAICSGPIFIPLSFSFMSDMGGLLALVLCFYGCVRAVQASSRNNAACWLFFAATSNILLGTVRQISWLGILVVVPSTTWLLRRWRTPFVLGILLWIIGAASVAGFSAWFSHQAYSLHEAFFAGSVEAHRLVQWAVVLLRSGLALSLMMLPILISFLLLGNGSYRPRFRTRIPILVFVATTLTISLLAAYLQRTHHSLRMITPFSNNVVTARGLVDLPDLLGHRADVVPIWIRIILLGLIAASLAAVAVVAMRRGRRPDGVRPTHALSSWQLVVLFGPFTASYLLLLITRGNLFDRYLLPILVVSAILTVRFYQRFIRADLTGLTAAFVLIIAAFSVAAMHDLFATGRARLVAAAKLQAMGIPRSGIRGGFEYDAWTQLETAGFINDPRINVPLGAYHPVARGSEKPGDCSYWFSTETPEVHGRFGLSYDAMPCGDDSPVTATPYRTWLPPTTRAIYTEALR